MSWVEKNRKINNRGGGGDYSGRESSMVGKYLKLPDQKNFLKSCDSRGNDTHRKMLYSIHFKTFELTFEQKIDQVDRK